MEQNIWTSSGNHSSCLTAFKLEHWVFSCLQIWKETSALSDCQLLKWTCPTGSPSPQAFWFRKEYIMGFSGSPAYWLALMIWELIRLHSKLSQFFKINLLECVCICTYIHTEPTVYTHTHTHTHTHILFILFIWRTLTNTDSLSYLILTLS